VAESWQSAWVEVLPDFRNFRGTANSQMSGILGAAGTAGGLVAGQNMGVGLLGGIKGIAGPLVGVVTALGIGKLVGDAIEGGIRYSLSGISLASDLNEAFNANEVMFGDQIAEQLEKLGTDAPKRLALTRSAFAQMATQFGAFAKTIRGNDVPGFIDELTTRGADFASVYNLEVKDALQLFQSGLAGETEPLRKFGLDLSAAAVESYAYRNGIAEVGTALTEAEKVQARYGALLEQTAAVQGDNANTAGELAGQQRRLNVAMEEAQTSFGQALLPTALDVVTFANEDLLPILSDALAKAGPKLAQSLEDVLPEIKELVGTAADRLPAAIEAAIGAVSLASDSFSADFGSGGIFDPEVIENLDDFFAYMSEPKTFDEFRDGFNNFFWGIRDGMTQADRDVKEKSDSIKEYWKANLAQMKADTEAASLASAGVAFAQGFADGIETGAEAAILAAERMALRTRDKVKNTMLIESPSRVMRELGGYVSEGFALGIGDNLALVDNAFGSLLPSGTAGSLAGTVQAGSAGTSGGLRDVHFHTEDPTVAYQMMKNEMGGRLATL